MGFQLDRTLVLAASTLVAQFLLHLSSKGPSLSQHPKTFREPKVGTTVDETNPVYITHNKEYTIIPIFWGHEGNAGLISSTVLTRFPSVPLKTRVRFSWYSALRRKP